MDFIDFFQFGVDFGNGYSYPTDLYIALLVGLIGYGIVYTFQAITLYTIGKRNGYGKVWMAFVPFVNTYYMGIVAEKNKIFGKKPKYFAIALAILEALLVVANAFYYVAFFSLEGTGNLVQSEVYQIMGVSYYELVPSTTVPASMEWLAWIYNYLGTIASYVNLVYIVLRVFVLISFFQTYAHGRYFIMALFSAILPIAGIIMFFVRKNKAMSYADYVRMVQERQYRQYQQNQRYGNPYNYNPYDGNPNRYNNNNSYNNSYNNNAANNNASADPFGEFSGSNSSNSNGSEQSSQNNSSQQEDPFEDF